MLVDSLSEGEIIPLSGLSKSGAGCIIQAGGASGELLPTGGIELQSATASSNIMQPIDSRFLFSYRHCNEANEQMRLIVLTS